VDFEKYRMRGWEQCGFEDLSFRTTTDWMWIRKSALQKYIGIVGEKSHTCQGRAIWFDIFSNEFRLELMKIADHVIRNKGFNALLKILKHYDIASEKFLISRCDVEYIFSMYNEQGVGYES